MQMTTLISVRSSTRRSQAGRRSVIARPLQTTQKLLSEVSLALLVFDLAVPDGDGLALLKELPALADHPIPVVLLSATEVSHEVQNQVVAALVKSRVSETHCIADPF